jgi:hypothetical protein
VEISGPRLRSILRRAEKVAKSGKYSAAATLYRQLIEEAPDVVAGWLGLAAVTNDTAEKEEALQRVLALEPENEHAKFLQAKLRGEAQPEDGQQFPVVPPAPSIVNNKTTALEEMAKADDRPEEKVGQPDTAEVAESEDETAVPPPQPPAEEDNDEEEAVEPETAESEPEDAQDPYLPDQPLFIDREVEADDTLSDHLAELMADNGGLPLDAEAGPAMVCYRHRKRETSLRCYSCERYICSQCAIKTPVGYRCPVCVREAEDVFFNATVLDYIIAPIISLPLSLLAGFLVLSMGSGFLMILIIFFLAGIIGGFIGRATKWAVGRRRGRYLAHIVAACVALGVLIPGLPLAVAVLFGTASFFALLGPGLYLFIAVSAAFYQVK